MFSILLINAVKTKFECKREKQTNKQIEKWIGNNKDSLTQRINIYMQTFDETTEKIIIFKLVLTGVSAIHK